MENDMSVTKELYNLSRIIKKKYHQAMESYSLENHNDIITTNNAEILSYLSENKDKDVFLKDIEKLLSVKPSTVNEIIRLMENKDLVVKSKSNNDARFRVVKITDKGNDILEEASNKVGGLDDLLTESLNEKELSNLKKYIVKIKKNLNK